MTVDYVFENSKVVMPSGIVKCGVAVDEGKIVAVAKESHLPKGDRTIDAQGNYLLPGIIDTHVHVGGIYYPLEKDIVETETAAWGGITTVGQFLGTGDLFVKGSYKPLFKKFKRFWEDHSIVDAFVHFFIGDEVQRQEIPDYVREFGVTSFKFHPYKGEENVAEVSDGDMYLGFKRIAEVKGAMAMVHCENTDIAEKLRVIAKKEENLVAYCDTRPNFIEAMDVEKAVMLARVTGAPLHIVHVTAGESVDIVARAKWEGIKITAETGPHWLLLNKYSARNLGALAVDTPALKDRESNEKLWYGIDNGIIECLCTDHASNIKENKKSIWTAMGATVQLETYLPVMLSEGVNKGRISLEKLVEICCYNNARVFGVYPRKGEIRVGSDADLVVVDLKKTVKVSMDKLHYKISDHCLFEGWDLKGWPVLTMLRGNILVEDGQFTGKPGIGRYIPRRLKNRVFVD